MITIKDKELNKVDIPLNSVYTPVIPCALDGNLSFLETLWKILYHLNIIVDAVNANHGDIEELAGAINELISDKLSVMWVELDVSTKPIKANKTFAEIAEGWRKGIVFLTINDVGTGGIAIPVDYSVNYITFVTVGRTTLEFTISRDESIIIAEYDFAVENEEVNFLKNVTFHDTANFNQLTQFHETTRFYKVITADRGITMPTATETDGRTYGANVEYVSAACEKTLKNAKDYADTQDAAVQKAATIYTNTTASNTLGAAKKYADEGDAKTLASAQGYTDNKFSHVTIVKNEDGTLVADNTFSTIYLNITRGVIVDVKYSSVNNRNSTYIMRNTIITPTKLTFIGYDETTAIHTCTIDSDNNITYE